MFISKNLRVIITKNKETNNLKRSPPQSEVKNTLSDFLMLSLISKKPTVKFRKESNAPNRMDLYNKLDRLEERNRNVIIAVDIKVTNRPETIKDFSFLIITGFQNRFNEGVQTSKYPKKCKNDSQNWVGIKFSV